MRLPHRRPPDSGPECNILVGHSAPLNLMQLQCSVQAGKVLHSSRTLEFCYSNVAFYAGRWPHHVIHTPLNHRCWWDNLAQQPMLQHLVQLPFQQTMLVQHLGQLPLDHLRRDIAFLQTIPGDTGTDNRPPHLSPLGTRRY